MNTIPSRRLSQPKLASLALAFCIGGTALQPHLASARPLPPRPAPSSTGARTGPTNTTTTTTTTTTSTSSTSTSTTSTIVPKPAPPKPDDVKLLEGALGRTLTDTEKGTIAAVAEKRNAAIDGARADFVDDVAAIFGLTTAELQAKVQATAKSGQCDEEILLTGALGRSLTTAERTALKAAIAAREAAIKAALDAYRAAVASAVGLTVAELDAKIKAFQTGTKPPAGPPPGGKPGGGKPGGGKQGPGGDCGGSGTKPPTTAPTNPTTPTTPTEPTDGTYQ